MEIHDRQIIENRTLAIAAASCGAVALAIAATWVIYCASRRLHGRPPVNAATCSVQDESPRPVHAHVQHDVNANALSDNTYVNVATPAQGHGTAHATWGASGQMGMNSALCVDEHHSSPEEHIYESASAIEEQMYTDCAKYQQKCSPDEHIYESTSDLAEPMYTDFTNCQESFPEESIYENASDIKEQMYTDCANYQQKCSPNEHIYESATHIEESSDSRSERSSIYECERDPDEQQSFRNSIYADFT
ncbi:uncharacterized protein LOC119572424 [Penaeus monodon]|uniref:uncharacterized protein LOC119572424 n=1 Tax=Penaeus monodon TaxID=6687 RepID=UPI0018A76FFE|nr:uncharacterized protein LOC119572424 [Penaeus monodon]